MEIFCVYTAEQWVTSSPDISFSLYPEIAVVGSNTVGKDIVDGWDYHLEKPF